VHDVQWITNDTLLCAVGCRIDAHQLLDSGARLNQRGTLTMHVEDIRELAPNPLNIYQFASGSKKYRFKTMIKSRFLFQAKMAHCASRMLPGRKLLLTQLSCQAVLGLLNGQLPTKVIRILCFASLSSVFE
jgi:hypothetical protein